MKDDADMNVRDEDEGGLKDSTPQYMAGIGF